MTTSINNRFTFTNARVWASANVTFLAVLGVILAIFATFGLFAANAPGLYMDAINPDYEVVKILHPDAPITVWEAPGDFLFGRFPVMFEIYAGSYVTYWMLPFSVVFGDSIFAVRLARVCFGLIFLCLVAILCRQLTRSNAIALAATLALAVDPTFVYGLRTQAYVVLFPLIFVIAALFTIHHFAGVRKYFAAGVLIGLAAFGYFVYLFTVPGVAIFAIRDAVPGTRVRAILALGMGVCVGLLPYALAYGLLFGALGWSGGMDWLHGALAGLHVTSDNSYTAHLVSTVTMIGLVLTGQWLELTIWQAAPFDLGQALKLCIVLGVPFIAFLALYSSSPAARRAFAAPILAITSFVVCATYFGPRLGGHDLTSVVTMCYLAGAVGAAALLSMASAYRKQLTIVLSVCAIVVVFGNLTSTAVLAKKLGDNGGGGLYSMAISEIPQAAEASGDKTTPYLFQSWGEMTAFIYETAGTIPAFSGDQLSGAVCRYGSANVVLLGDEANFPSATSAFPPSGFIADSDRLLHDSKSGFPYRLMSVKSAAPSANCLRAPGAKSNAATVAPPVTGASPTSVAPALAAKAMLQLKTQSSGSGIVFEAQPNPVALGDGGALPVVSIRWVVPSASKIEIHAGSADGQIFTIGGNAGVATTGPWVQAGDKFYLQDVSAGGSGKTVSIMTVSTFQSSSRPH